MLTQLSTVKARLAIADIDTTNDALLTAALAAVSARFDQECARILARTENATEEFDPGDGEICPPCYPVESVSKFELKTSESGGWQEVQPAPEHLIRRGCVISLLAGLPASSSSGLARVTYTGGYVLPGATAGPGQTPLPPHLEQAAIEQVAYWFQNREKVGAIRYWPKGAVYEQFADLDLLPSVRAVLFQFRRWVI